MSYLDVSHASAGTHQVFPAVLSRLWQAIVAIYITPFRMLARANSAESSEQIEQQWRLHLFRLINVSYTAGLLLLALALVVFGRTSLLFRGAELVVITLNIICLCLSYSRWPTLATVIFLLSSLTFSLVMIEYDIDALSGRSLLVYSLISVLILAAGILLPHHLVWIVVPFIIGAALFTLMGLPLQLSDPRPLVIGVLFIQYVFAVLLTWLYVRSTSLRFKTLVAALAYEQELLQQKDAFINIASHELRTPLTALLLDVRLIERYLHQPERADRVAELTGNIAKHVQHMDAMIATLLDASLISQHLFVLKKEWCDVAACIREAVEEQAKLFARQVALAGVAEPILGMTDCRRICQVVTHLVGNALKFSPADTPVNVAVSLKHQGSAQVLHVEVRDMGAGISPQILPQLFARTYHVRDVNAEQFAGLGLGLYISNTIITLHGGAIWVDSTLGQGSTLYFEIPL